MKSPLSQIPWTPVLTILGLGLLSAGIALWSLAAGIAAGGVSAIILGWLTEA